MKVLGKFIFIADSTTHCGLKFSLPQAAAPTLAAPGKRATIVGDRDGEINVPDARAAMIEMSVRFTLPKSLVIATSRAPTVPEFLSRSANCLARNSLRDVWRLHFAKTRFR